MRYLYYILISGIILTLASCSKSSDDGSSNPLGSVGNPTNTGGVTFTMGHRSGDQGGIMFTTNPSTDITVTQIVLTLPAQSFADTLVDDGTTVYAGNQVYDLAEYSGVATGQQWTFNFQGKLGSAQGSAYNVTSSYTVQ